jgi:hypothetical protein
MTLRMIRRADDSGGSLPRFFGNGKDGNILVTGTNVSIRDIYELDNCTGVTTKRGVNKGLNNGALSLYYSPETNRGIDRWKFYPTGVIQARNFTVASGASLINESCDVVWADGWKNCWNIWICCNGRLNILGAILANGKTGTGAGSQYQDAYGGSGYCGGGGGGGAGSSSENGSPGGGGGGTHTGVGGRGYGVENGFPTGGLGGGGYGCTGGGGGGGGQGDYRGNAGGTGVNGVSSSGAGNGGDGGGTSSGDAYGGNGGSGGGITMTNTGAISVWDDLYGKGGNGAKGARGQWSTGSSGGGGGGHIRIYANKILSLGTLSVAGGSSSGGVDITNNSYGYGGSVFIVSPKFNFNNIDVTSVNVSGGNAADTSHLGKIFLSGGGIAPVIIGTVPSALSSYISSTEV